MYGKKEKTNVFSSFCFIYDPFKELLYSKMAHHGIGKCICRLQTYIPFIMIKCCLFQQSKKKGYPNYNKINQTGLLPSLPLPPFFLRDFY